MRRGVARGGLTSALLVLAATVVPPTRASSPRWCEDAPPAFCSQERFHAPRPPPEPDPASRSIGEPWNGRLEGAVRLEASEHLRFVDADAEAQRHWGTVELVRLIERAARRVAARRPGARLNVGELSARRGGNAPWHRSHESGRDVDFGFYLLDDAEQPVEPARFVEVAANGAGSWGGHVRFDDQRNWLLVEALLTDPGAHVKYVFVADTVRARLLREARRRSVAPYLYERARKVIMQPRHVEDHPHANHFHVRIYCAPDDVPDCHDAPPYWPWLPASHPFGG